MDSKFYIDSFSNFEDSQNKYDIQLNFKSDFKLNSVYFHVKFNSVYFIVKFNSVYINVEFNSVYINVKFNSVYINVKFNSVYINVKFNSVYFNVKFNSVCFKILLHVIFKGFLRNNNNIWISKHNVQCKIYIII